MLNSVSGYRSCNQDTQHYEQDLLPIGMAPCQLFQVLCHVLIHL